jgi:hypothetical protein
MTMTCEVCGTVYARTGGPDPVDPPVTPPVTPPVKPPVTPPAGAWTPPANAIILGTLTPNAGNVSKAMNSLGVMYAIQLTADARDAGFSCPSGYCTAGINGVYSAQGMDTAVVFGKLKAGDWLMCVLGLENPAGSGNWGNHNANASALFSAHA